MIALHYQPAIEPQRTFGESPFRLEPAGSMSQVFHQSITRGGQIPFTPGLRFAAAGSDDFWANRCPAGLPAHRRRLPVIRATGRIITQQEIDDALDD